VSALHCRPILPGRRRSILHLAFATPIGTELVKLNLKSAIVLIKHEKSEQHISRFGAANDGGAFEEE